MSRSDYCRLIDDQLVSAAKILRQGGVVAFPTESSYGLAVTICSDKALQRLYQLKGRAADKAFPVLIESREQLLQLAASVPPLYEVLIKQFWPGPLTLVFPARRQLSPVLTGGKKTIAIRRSSHPVATGLVAAVGGPITATSANRSGDSPCTTAAEVKEVFGSRIDLIIDGGKAAAPPSTIVALRAGKLNVLREGQLPAARFSNIMPDIRH